jgi:hypothetical protein
MYGKAVSSREKRTLLRRARDITKSLGNKCYDVTSDVSKYIGRPLSKAVVCIDYTRPLDIRYTGKYITRNYKEKVRGWIHGEEWSNQTQTTGWWKFKKKRRYIVKYPAKLKIEPSYRTFSLSSKTYNVTDKVRSVLGGDVIKATLYVDRSRPIKFRRYGSSKPRSRSIHEMVRGWQRGIESVRDKVGPDYYWVDYHCKLHVERRKPTPTPTPSPTPTPGPTPTPSPTPGQGGTTQFMPGMPRVSEDGKYLIIPSPNGNDVKVPLPPSPPIPSVG